jgi:hypothetical protein
MTDIPDEIKEEPTATIIVPAHTLQAITDAPSGQRILEVCIEIAEFLAIKNTAYGNSALQPIRIFSKASTVEQILVRIDDKLNRLINGGGYPGDDDIRDLLGYLVLYYVAVNNDKTSDEG